ncbi:uncharacterized protein B0P05DRAFT_546090 [Gilbertella persicaria]|uniref:uncharacterized protein n=1 Tax=Gilbertella persicaria TaxID=101096 RepID=UPI00221F72F5|nr:uncharacterized protein B0P05DRAFT_546090 [Gilbertella persicaria]KAI8076491.1 hypothetical protein B0P05DRAFT_546090 [Gilbertella persicaria]
MSCQNPDTKIIHLYWLFSITRHSCAKTLVLKLEKPYIFFPFFLLYRNKTFCSTCLCLNNLNLLPNKRLCSVNAQSPLFLTLSLLFWLFVLLPLLLSKSRSCFKIACIGLFSLFVHTFIYTHAYKFHV